MDLVALLGQFGEIDHDHAVGVAGHGRALPRALRRQRHSRHAGSPKRRSEAIGQTAGLPGWVRLACVLAGQR